MCPHCRGAASIQPCTAHEQGRACNNLVCSLPRGIPLEAASTAGGDYANCASAHTRAAAVLGWDVAREPPNRRGLDPGYGSSCNDVEPRRPILIGASKNLPTWLDNRYRTTLGPSRTYPVRTTSLVRVLVFAGRIHRHRMKPKGILQVSVIPAARARAVALAGSVSV